LGGEGNDVGLGDRLASADGKCPIVIRLPGVGVAHEKVSGNPLHSSQHLGVGDVPSGQVYLHHVLPGACVAVYSVFLAHRTIVAPQRRGCPTDRAVYGVAASLG